MQNCPVPELLPFNKAAAQTCDAKVQEKKEVCPVFLIQQMSEVPTEDSGNSIAYTKFLLKCSLGFVT